ncbi:MAG: hypothetical protein HC923_00085 [Myxococcales bacterium]|nr:hypothetical protein [Myxococcales bacterium]
MNLRFERDPNEPMGDGPGPTEPETKKPSLLLVLAGWSGIVLSLFRWVAPERFSPSTWGWILLGLFTVLGLVFVVVARRVSTIRYPQDLSDAAPPIEEPEPDDSDGFERSTTRRASRDQPNRGSPPQERPRPPWRIGPRPSQARPGSDPLR